MSTAFATPSPAPDPERSSEAAHPGRQPTSRRVRVRPGDVAARQSSLFDQGEQVAFDRSLSTRRRHELADGAWVDVVPGLVQGSLDLFDRVVAAAEWRAEEMVLFDEVVACPRLSVRWTVGELPDELVVLRSLGAVLSQCYRTALTRVSANLYRDGRDSVAWHGDRGARDRDRATIAVLTLGSPRPFRLRRRRGPGGLALEPASGDLLVMGGTCQRTWQHAVPKVADAGPRIAVMFRTSLDG
ncbi:alpha-ketoglutarate-dependent dioxygenase AlkB [Nitriliruptoria bacterium AS10]|nr:alpha-ketoglutarate-dependent dioxygenase AlkB [Salsipaludibacter albus]